MSYDSDFLDQLREDNPRTWEDVLGYYQKEFPGQKMRINKKTGEVKTIQDWQGKLATDLTSHFKSKNIDIKRASVMRRFQGARAGKVSEKQQAEYEELGKTLPPLVPEGGYHIFGTIWVKYSEECVERFPDETLSKEEVEAIIAAGGLQAFANFYNTGDVNEGKYAICDAPDLHIEAID